MRKRLTTTPHSRKEKPKCPATYTGARTEKRFIMVFESWNALNDDDEVPDGCTPYMYNICDSETNEELDA